eukprot:1183842-Prorocentrum_minimum.AAC.1
MFPNRVEQGLATRRSMVTSKPPMMRLLFATRRVMLKLMACAARRTFYQPSDQLFDGARAIKFGRRGGTDLTYANAARSINRRIDHRTPDKDRLACASCFTAFAFRPKGSSRYSLQNGVTLA